MSADCTILVNTSSNDNPYSGSPSDFTEVDVDNDYLILSGGSSAVADGEPIPSETQLNQAGPLIQATAVTISKYFLADIDAVELKQIHNMGNLNKRYVMCLSFDDATASEPVLEIWDDEDLDTNNLYSLGEGVAADSWWKGIVTTDALPGADWTGLALSGNSDNHFLWLNNGSGSGALTGAKDLYCQLKVIIPANFQYSAVEEPVIAVKWTSN